MHVRVRVNCVRCSLHVGVLEQRNAVVHAAVGSNMRAAAAPQLASRRGIESQRGFGVHIPQGAIHEGVAILFGVCLARRPGVRVGESVSEEVKELRSEGVKE